MSFMLETDAYELLEKNGLSLPRYGFALSAEGAVETAREMGYPVVMKIVSADIIHKSDVGGVKLGLANDQEVETAFHEIMAAASKAVPGGRHHGVLITQMVKGGVETIIGLGVDPEFGKFIMFGLGGVYVELFKDVAFRMVPLSSDDARSLINDVKGSALLKAFRGSEPKDVEALVELLVSCSRLAESNPDIYEMDLNPVKVMEKGAYILDARILQKKNSNGNEREDHEEGLYVGLQQCI